MEALVPLWVPWVCDLCNDVWYPLAMFWDMRAKLRARDASVVARGGQPTYVGCVCPSVRARVGPDGWVDGYFLRADDRRKLFIDVC